jgi:hypothetical protein
MDPREHETTGQKGAPAPGGSHDETPSGTAQADDSSRRRGNRHHTSRRRNRSQPRGDGSDRATGDADAGRLQASMESGRLSGKRAAEDPGAVPLGTDEEAAGTPLDSAAIDHEVARAEAQRSGRSALTAEEAIKGRPGHPEESPRGFGKLVTISAAIIIAIIALFVLL